MAIILDLCGGTGAWSKPYKDAGYDVINVTLPQYDVISLELYDAQLLFWGERPPISCKNVVGILAAPPCTEFSLAKGSRPRDFGNAMEIVAACMRIIWYCRIWGKPQFWAMENPKGFLRQFLGKPAYTFEQWMFGGDHIKPTDLWGYFNPPNPTVKEMPTDMTTRYPNGRSNGRSWAKVDYLPEYTEYINQFKGDAKRAAARAITPPGFAEAFYKANKPKEVVR